MTKEELTKTRLSLKMTQDEFAQVVNESRGYIAQIECGKRSISPIKSISMDTALGDWLRNNPEQSALLSRNKTEHSQCPSCHRPLDAHNAIITTQEDRILQKIEYNNEATIRNYREISNLANTLKFISNTLNGVESFKATLQAQFTHQFLIILEMLQVIIHLASTTGGRQEVTAKLQDLENIVREMANMTHSSK